MKTCTVNGSSGGNDETRVNNTNPSDSLAEDTLLDNRTANEIRKLNISTCEINPLHCVLPGISSSKMVPVAIDCSPIVTPGLLDSNLINTSNDSSPSGIVSLNMVTVKILLITPLGNVMFWTKLS